MKAFTDFMKEKTVLFDGAMGTQIQKLDIDPGILPDELNILQPEAIINIHLAYLESGSDVLTANTFGSNAYKNAGRRYTPDELISAGIACAKEARERYRAKGNTRPIYIALDLGPIGALLEPSGHIRWEQAYELYREQVISGVRSGAELILIETQTDLAELRCAVLACKENSSLPILCTMSFERSGRTFTGTDPQSMATTLEDIGVEAVGFNCSFGTKEMRPLIEQLLKTTNLPVMVQPNAGLPDEVGEGFCFDPFVADMKYFVEQGVGIIGGCCGTSPDTIRLLHEMLKTAKGERKRNKLPTRICSYARTVEIGKMPRIIGERINPTGKKAFQEELRGGKLDHAIREAVRQSQEGADILDVNVGTSGVDESELLPRLVCEIQSILDLPLQIDSSSVQGIENAVRIYNGKPLINSVNGKEESLSSVLPIAKKYGACVLGLTLDENGIPETVEERIRIAEKILDRALALGIPKENLLIDCLTLTISTDPENAKMTNEALRIVKEKLGLCTALGVSNISFGLPNRNAVNQAFLLSALYSGLDLPIINTANGSMIEAIDSYCVLSGRDEGARSYIAKYADKPQTRIESNAQTTLYQAILSGMNAETLALTQELLEKKSAIDIIDEDLIPVLNDIGSKFEKGELFLPQLIQSSQTVKLAFDRVKQELTAENTDGGSKGRILLATVEHDVHDIGKNIVKVVLENYGFEVVDLGRDVPAKKVVEECRARNIRLVGLSALMTTTVASMERTIRLLKAELPDSFVIVGGAVLNSRYAQEIGADRYAKHPSETAQLAQQFFEERGL